MSEEEHIVRCANCGVRAPDGYDGIALCSSCFQLLNSEAHYNRQAKEQQYEPRDRVEGDK